jgi:cytochrome c
MRNLTHRPRLSLSRQLCAALALLAGASHSFAADLKAGADVFAVHCAECHSLKEGKNKKGPSLFGAFGRKAGTLSDVAYSDAMKASALTWTAQALDTYLSAPKKAVPGGKMKYDGLPDAQARTDLIAYLATVK